MSKKRKAFKEISEFFEDDASSEIEEMLEEFFDNDSWIYTYITQILQRIKSVNDLKEFFVYLHELPEDESDKSVSISYVQSVISEFETNKRKEKNLEFLTPPEDIDNDNPEIDDASFSEIIDKLFGIQAEQETMGNNVNDLFFSVSDFKSEFSDFHKEAIKSEKYAEDTYQLIHSLSTQKSDNSRPAEYDQVEKVIQIVSNGKKLKGETKEKKIKSILKLNKSFNLTSVVMVVMCFLCLVIVLLLVKGGN
ncbi:hypothetical protein [Breznakia pachnodae]|uniref:Uncharacterized protein n=1 Tax=Breznakia pachnodae TaxID=265178 RepID=A0ABU0E4Y6_9FIRM|nr:hypothetical protein [Breznakia pachnodae]MDQ0361565.1 hypothetical protein [Breznakia pachnodae]